MTVRNEAPESKFSYVIVAARRARQLMGGAPPLVDNPQSRQPTRIAQQELRSGLLQYEGPAGQDEAQEQEEE